MPMIQPRDVECAEYRADGRAHTEDSEPAEALDHSQLGFAPARVLAPGLGRGRRGGAGTRWRVVGHLEEV